MMAGEHGATTRGQRRCLRGLLTGDPTQRERVSRTDMAETASIDRTRRERNRLRFISPLVQSDSMLDFG